VRASIPLFKRSEQGSKILFFGVEDGGSCSYLPFVGTKGPAGPRISSTASVSMLAGADNVVSNADAVGLAFNSPRMDASELQKRGRSTLCTNGLNRETGPPSAWKRGRLLITPRLRSSRRAPKPGTILYDTAPPSAGPPGSPNRG
jgi:hypothetical protein